MKLKAIDLFAGIGGIRQGFQDYADFVFSSEWDKFAQQTYYENFNEMPLGDITKIDASDVPNHDLLLAGFPCQPFSNIGKREGFNHETQGTLFFDVLRILEHHQPDMFLLENVTGLLTMQQGETMRIILDNLRSAGYNVFYSVLDAQNFGIPQRRRRVIIVGFKKSLNINSFALPESNSKETPNIGSIVEKTAPEGYTISKKLQKNYLFKKDDGKPQIINSNSKGVAKTLVASYHKIQRITGTFVEGGETGLRLLSELEIKRLMGFSEDFIIPVSRTQMYRQMGNSVVIPVIEEVANEMIKVYNGKKQTISNQNQIEQVVLF